MDKIVEHSELKKLVLNKLSKVGVRNKEAETVSDVLVHANLRGVDSHGVLRVENYITRILEGGLNIHSKTEFKQQSDSVAIYNGDHGFGHVNAKVSMEHAIIMAKKNGVGLVSVKNSSHCGALSYFVKQAINQDLIGISMTNVESLVAPFGAAQSYFGTNPMAFGFPTKNKESVLFDFATSNVAYGKIMNAQLNDEEIPQDWGLDIDGKPTNDPHKVVSLTPFGGPKGYGLAMVVEILAGLLSESAIGPNIPKMLEEHDKKLNIGHFLMVIDPKKFLSIDTFLNNIDNMINDIHELSPAPGFNRIYAPGEIEEIKEKKRLVEGIPVPSSVLDYLNS